MFKFKLQKFETLVNFIHNSLVNNKNIIVFIGNNGTFLGAISNNKLIDSLFIPLEDQNNLELYKCFLKKYNKFYIFFFYDDNSCELRHELIPVLQTVVKVNPVEKFIDEHFLPTDITTYCVYDVTHKSGEVWNTLIAKVPYQPPLSDILNYILENSLKFGGIYYLNLEYITIIDKILQKSKNTHVENHLQIFAYITKISAIKFVVKHKHDIISVKSVPYPVDRTELYIQGIMEQEISDYLISFKNYILKHEVQVAMIFLVNNSLKALLIQSKLEPHTVICLSNEEINSRINNKEGFSDEVIAELFSNNKTFLGLNKAIKSITQISLVNFLIFKPLALIIIALIISLINIKFWTYRNIKKTEAIDTQNYQILQEYRNVRQKYPDIKDVANLADLYSLTALLKVPILTPFDFLEKFFSHLTPNISIDKISWKLLDPNNIVQTSEYIKVNIELKYITEDMTPQNALENLHLYINQLKQDASNFTINYRIHVDKITNLLNRVIIPITFWITGPSEL